MPVRSIDSIDHRNWAQISLEHPLRGFRRKSREDDSGETHILKTFIGLVINKGQAFRLGIDPEPTDPHQNQLEAFRIKRLLRRLAGKGKVRIIETEEDTICIGPAIS